MKPISKSTFLERLNIKATIHLKQVKDKLQNLDENVLIKQASNGGWNIIQCIEHLNTYSDYYLPEISKAIQSSNVVTNENFTSGWLGNYFVNMMNPENGNKKYKADPKHIPTISKTPHTVISEFIKNQENLLEYLVRAENVNLKIRIPISINRFIKLKLGDVFSFLVMHNERHIQQALRNIEF